MREIKFRVWDKVTKKMFTGFHLFGEMTLTGGIHAWQHEEAEAIGIKRDTLGALCDLEEMQYTGLKDKNGKEIYEGDIVNVWHQTNREFDGDGYYTKGIVEYSPAEFYIRGDGHSITCHFHYNDADREVIGNIHENPELL